jgi:hypothetical protein
MRASSQKSYAGVCKNRATSEHPVCATNDLRTAKNKWRALDPPSQPATAAHVICDTP